MISADTVSIPRNRTALTVEYKSPSDLKPYSFNARTHSKHQIRQIAESIRVFGFTNPILIDRENHIVAGHGRVEGAIRRWQNHTGERAMHATSNISFDEIAALKEPKHA